MTAARDGIPHRLFTDGTGSDVSLVNRGESADGTGAMYQIVIPNLLTEPELLALAEGIDKLFWHKHRSG